jgi:hypothetical protein
MEYQAELAREFIKGTIKSSEITSIHENFEKSRDLSRNGHDLGNGLEFVYCDAISSLIQTPLVPEWKREMRKNIKQLRIDHLGY